MSSDDRRGSGEALAPKAPSPPDSRRAWVAGVSILAVLLAWSVPAMAQPEGGLGSVVAERLEGAAEAARVPETAYGADAFNGPPADDWLLGNPFRLVPRPRAETVQRLPRGRPVDGGFAGRRLLLTFDDGPFPESTPRLLEILRRERVPAVFFLLGSRVQDAAHRRQGRRVARMIVQDGHAVGNHSFSHPHLTQLDPDVWKSQIVRGHDAVRSAVGYSPTLFRAPYGTVNSTIDRYLEYRGYTRLHWTYVADEFRGRTPDVMVRGILEQIRERERGGRNVGGVLLLHDAHVRSIDCAELLIRRIKAENCALLEEGDEDVWRFVDAASFYQPIGAPDETEALGPSSATPAEVEEARTWCEQHHDELDGIRALDRLEVDINDAGFGRAGNGEGYGLPAEAPQ